MAARSTARKRAVQILFEADHREVPVRDVLADWVGRAEPPVNEYTMDLVEGYCEHTEQIDRLISEYAVGWTLDRMPIVDRNILRLGVHELVWVDDVPDAVVLDEAVRIAKEFSTDESPAFVNGLLGRIKAHKAKIQR
ncbi:transcription antitermination factor NusB [Allostreptomyces psammosilenae]|uniref:Transcription antitermination protein NusB n=1 Tax=Allostreptomyces psammosilenae TaxID=1892865 RepID=A0A853A3C9_9ACTN|nr:transcription antitermination factor NusB [Allostreptomyces psammosilenae]NYI04988.1 N utilization substance protein B [Allostreptomyces psammosilenae]